MSTSQIPTRVRFFNGQFLQAADLSDEQTYHMQMRWRHNLALHSWGIVDGLIPRVEGAESKQAMLVVGPGMALDGYGREIVLTSIYTETLQERSTDDSYDIWISYRLKASSSSGGNRCAGASRGDRVLEDPEIFLNLTSTRRSPDPSKPDEVAPGDLEFPPQAPLPTSDDQLWPVFLGRLMFQEGRWKVDGSQRRPAGLVAGSIRSPATVDGTRTVVVNGPQPDFDRYVFAVLTEVESTTQNRPVVAVTNPANDTERPRIELAADRVRVGADLTLKDGAAIEFQPNLIQGGDHSEIPRGAGNWRMYRHFEPPEKTTIDGKALGGFTDEVRITLPQGEHGDNRFVVGCFSDQGKFVPVLAVLDDRRVEIYGTLTVNGQTFATLSNAPAGQTGGSASGSLEKLVDTVVDRIEDGQLPSLTVIQHFVQPASGGASVWPKFASAIGTATDSAKIIDPVTEELWKTSKGRVSIGKKGKLADSNGFKEFLSAIPNDAEDQLGFISDWAFEDSTTRAGHLVANMPEDSDNSALKAFAKELVKSDAKLKALLKAILDVDDSGSGLDGADVAAKVALASGPTRFKKLVDHLITNGGDTVLAQELAARSKNATVATAFLGSGSNDAFLTEVGKQLPTDAAHVTPLLGGSDAMRLALALALLGKSDSTGKTTLVTALKADLPAPTSPMKLTDSDSTRLRAFMKRVKAEATPSTALDRLILYLNFLTQSAIIDDPSF